MLRRAITFVLVATSAVALTGCAAAPTAPQEADSALDAPSATPRASPGASTAPDDDRTHRDGYSVTTPDPTPTPATGSGALGASSLLALVNKRHPLEPLTYTPTDLVTAEVPHANPPVLRAAAANALAETFAAARREGGGTMQVQSAYRSHDTQVSVYQGWVGSLGQAQADRQSARPGYSEHQTGLAVDISAVPSTCALAACFADTPQGRWLAENAWRFGFVLRYPDGASDVTGYTFEPWHFRYIGTERAADYHQRQTPTLEAYLGSGPAPTY